MVRINAKRVTLEAAKIASRDPAMEAELNSYYSRVKARAARKVDTGSYYQSIKKRRVLTKRGVLDGEVYSDHPRARFIEYGGFNVRSGRINPGVRAFKD